MHKWCASEIKEQPGPFPQMTETAQLVLNLGHGKESGRSLVWDICPKRMVIG